MPLTLKKCSLSDLQTLVYISKKTFVEAFEKDNNTNDFQAYIKTAFDEHTIKQQLANPDSRFYFILKNEQQVGYFKLNINKAQTDLKKEDTLELERIYVLKEYQGQQIGKFILQEVFKITASLNKNRVWLGVWEKNTNAIRFYEKYGFLKFDTHPYYIGNDKQTDWLMEREIENGN